MNEDNDWHLTIGPIGFYFKSFDSRAKNIRVTPLLPSTVLHQSYILFLPLPLSVSLYQQLINLAVGIK